MRIMTTAALTLTVLAGMTLVAAPAAHARPQYIKAFVAKYPQFEDEAKKTVKCAICHPPGEKKDVNNDYGTALKKALGEENVKDDKKIDEAFTAIEKEDSKTAGKTFGDLIKANKLPGTNPPAAAITE